ncbi:hypothetical protein [Myxococcus virescens]|uniref:Uncharacterized protein n=1 Tax=Myxococcus virescens TaxID=83456 RepID=A0A511HPI9_9BACT|nr:hypothetical protein [Myxococcus virescens]GEL75516.1 hypothetical protein MVI01_73000 [Myxococcus virescens]SDD65747.1 hypothetical protein SAMN04488504_102154 [Myxococcus virescens]
MSAILDAKFAADLLNREDVNPMGYGEFKLGSVPGVVLVLEHGKFKASFQVTAPGRVKRAGLRKVKSVTSEHIIKALEGAGYEMVD